MRYNKTQSAVEFTQFITNKTLDDKFLYKIYFLLYESSPGVISANSPQAEILQLYNKLNIN